MFVLGTRTLDRHGRETVRNYLTRGGQVFLAMWIRRRRSGDAWRRAWDERRVRGGAGADTGRDDDRRATAVSIFRPFLHQSGALGDVQVEQHRRLMDQADRTVLARFSGGDAAADRTGRGKGRLIVFTSDLDNEWSRFPLNAAFVPFAVETARYLTKAFRAPPGGRDRRCPGVESGSDDG